MAKAHGAAITEADIKEDASICKVQQNVIYCQCFLAQFVPGSEVKQQNETTQFPLGILFRENKYFLRYTPKYRPGPHSFLPGGSIMRKHGILNPLLLHSTTHVFTITVLHFLQAFRVLSSTDSKYCSQELHHHKTKGHTLSPG